MTCKKCESHQLVKSGFVAGAQRYKCKSCGYQFVPTRTRNRSTREKETAVLLYVQGLSMNAIAKLFKVSSNTIMLWVRAAGQAQDKPPPDSNEIIVELDEMWHFLTSKKQKLWIWKAYCRTSKRLIDWEFGKRDKTTFLRLYKRLKRWNILVYFTDHWKAYSECIPEHLLIQTKAQTYRIEQNNGRQRHWFARFRRKSVVVSRTLAMLEATMALFANFHVNGTLKLKSLF